jgi:hypothetical protein
MPRHAVLVVAVLLVSAVVIGQEDPLPPVVPRAQTPVLVALAVEPMHELSSVSLEDAARSNDYATFHALFEETRNPAYAPLHELWTYAVNDPIGAFYGAEMYERFASLYPGFASYIDEYKIVDDHGNVFYPTSETRSFLLARAAEGRPLPQPEPIRVASAKRRSGFSSPTPVRRVRWQKAEVSPEPKKAVGPKPEPRLAPVSEPAAVVAETAPAPAPVVAASMIPEVPLPQPEAQGDLTARGILLILIGVAGIGFLALILRGPATSPAGDLRKAPR